jgi:hypothetical protein
MQHSPFNPKTLLTRPAQPQISANNQLLLEARGRLQLLHEERRGAEAQWARERGELEGRLRGAEAERDKAFDSLNFQVGWLVGRLRVWDC